MEEGHSATNLLLPKQQYNFEQSFAVPLKFNPSKTKPNNFTHTKTQSSFGQYEQYKLTNYLKQMHNADDLDALGNYIDRNVQNKKESKVIEVVTIDADSSFIEMGEQFAQLMLKYVSNDVVFVTVSGEKQTGKSFFIDKLLNLAEIKGNNVIVNSTQFSQKRKPALYTFSVPFTKDDLCIFLLEVSGCAINAHMFRVLNFIAMALSSSFIFLAGKSNAHWDSFQQCLQKSEQFLQFGESKWNISELFPTTVYNVSRHPQQSSVVLKTNAFFKEIETLYLADAMTPGYTGKRQDLSSISFLAKQCINPEYIKQVHSIFMTVYKDTEEKKYPQLVVNGNIAHKILLAIVANLNANKKLNLNAIYENVVKQLYVTAFNYCVMVYHEQLQQYFEDEQPKNTDEMYTMFEKASSNALQKFNNYNMNEQLHQQFEEKLINHIASKQQLICSINKQKTQQLLKGYFNNYCDDAQSTIQMLRTYRKQLDDGRVEAMQEKILEMISMADSGNAGALMRQLERLNSEKEKLQTECQRLVEQRREEKSKNLKQQMKLKEFQAEENNIDEERLRLQQEIASLKKRQKSLENGESDEEVVNELKRKLAKLNDKAQKSTETLNNLNEDNQSIYAYEERRNNAIKKQKQIEKQLQQLYNQQQSPNKQSKQKQNSTSREKSKSKTKNKV